MSSGTFGRRRRILRFLPPVLLIMIPTILVLLSAGGGFTLWGSDMVLGSFHIRGLVGRFLRDLLGNPASAADATQETFVRAFRRIPTLRDDARLLPWLFGIARNVALEQRKALRREAGTEQAGEAHDGLTPEAALLGREAAAVLGRAMRTLSHDRRTVLLLRVDHHLPYEEISNLMGWSLAKTKVEIHRGREVLRAELARWEAGP